MNLETAIVYDCETFPNCFTLHMECLNSDLNATWEISHFRDDRQALVQWFNWLHQTQTAMIGFFSLGFDYLVAHYIFNNPHVTVEQIYEFAMNLIGSDERFGNMIWADDRFAPQIDLAKIHHFDNKAKRTSLKALQINMRLPTVVESNVPFGTILTEQQVSEDLIPYNIHDVKSTNKFAHISMPFMEFRVSLIEQFGVDVMNWADTKIGSRMMEDKLGKELCYDYSSGKKTTRQTPRTRIALADIIFPYIQFQNPEFQRIHEYFKNQVLTADELKRFTDEIPKVQIKGVFTNLKATVGGIDFHFGTGGIHGSLSSQKVVATSEWLIRDIDVASLYPSIAIVNNLAPAHLGEHFSRVYAELPKERKKWQAEKGKKCIEANTLKLASNGVYGNSNNMWSCFYDPQFTLTITINGQLLLCMLAETLLTVPTLRILAINTDGITYYIQREYEPLAASLCKQWETLTALVLEDQSYSRVWLRDVNSYIAESMDGSLKIKGAYWTPDPLDYHNSISEAQPPAWHKDLGNLVSVRAAVAAMVHGTDIEQFIRLTTNPYDFMCRFKTNRSDKLFWGEETMQRNTRYYVSTAGRPLVKKSPPAGKEGAPKRAGGVTESDYLVVMATNGWQWDERVCTKNKNTYTTRTTAIQAGHNVVVCNDVEDFRFDTVDYNWYVNEARKLVV